MKVLVLCSGGLDSILAVKAIKEADLEPIAVHFYIPFENKEKNDFYDSCAAKYCSQWNVEIKIIDISEDFLVMMKSPQWGFGKNINPCRDCKILMLKKAEELMKVYGASFIATGEVVGQRPMSQTKDGLKCIARESGIEDFIVRPLSGKLLAPTEPEKRGWISREKMFDLNGRGRNQQFFLAAKWGIVSYPNPAGGCLLTDPTYSKRLAAVMQAGMLTYETSQYCKCGRFFVLGEKTFALVGRDEADNDKIEKFDKRNVVFFRNEKNTMGPTVMLFGEVTQEYKNNCAGLLLRYTKKIIVKKVFLQQEDVFEEIIQEPISENFIREKMIV